MRMPMNLSIPPRGRIASLLAVGILTILSAGCASVQHAPVGADSSAKQFSAASDRATLYIFRRPGFVGSAVAIQVSINGRVLGGTGPGTYFVVRLDPGTHVISSFTPESSPALTLTLEAGRIYFVEQATRFGVANARATLEQVDENEGRAAVIKCRLLESIY